MKRESKVLLYVGIFLYFAALVGPLAADEGSPGDAKEKSSYPTGKKFNVPLNPKMREVNIDVGVLQAGKQSSLQLHLKNESTQDVEVAEIAVSCKCVVGELNKKNASPGEGLELDVKLLSTQVVEEFTQKLTLRFAEDRIPPMEIIFRAVVSGEVDVSPRTLRFKDGNLQVINVKTTIEGLRLKHFEFMSSVLAIQKREDISESEVNLHVVHTASSGQAIEVLRIAFSDAKGKDTFHTEVKLGVSSAQDFRFIPSSLQITDLDSECVRRVFLAFSGAYCPSDEEVGTISVRLSNGDSAKMPDAALSLVRRRRRLFEIDLNLAQQEVPSDSIGLVVKFNGREFLVPFVK